MKQLKNLDQLAKILSVECPFKASFNSFSVDSRTIQEGDLFIALPGQKVDGERFIHDALAKGAKALMLKRGANIPENVPHIIVEDVLKALQDLAHFYFEEHRPKVVIGITGSLGKTSAKECLKELLKDKFKIFITPGNANSQVGLPLSILNYFQGNEDVAILEMGMTEKGHIEKLIEIAPPDIALITKVALVHAENFDSFQGIAEAKSEIFLHPKTYLGIYDGNIDLIYDLSKRGNCQKRKMIDSFASQEIDALTGPIRHNLLAAYTVAKELGIDESHLISVAKDFLPLKNRGEVVEIKGVTFVNDSYNASPESMKAAFVEIHKREAKGKKVAVIGSMLELGKYEKESHREIGEKALLTFNELICLGSECNPMVELWNKFGKPVTYCENLEEVVNSLREIVKEGDVVLLKGSNSKQLWKVLEKY